METSKRDAWLKLPFDEVFRQTDTFSGAKWHNAHADILKRFYSDAILPIEFLKECPDLIERDFAAPVAHHFLSSGTTARDRSRSSFTAEGLKHYHDFSLYSFDAMLRHFFGERKTKGISMIPPTSEWPQSSLAQMLAWIGETHALNYWHETNPLPTEPIWFFATGFHIVAFADAGGYFPLPKGSIVIETGGTKGKTRSVSREETYELIEKCFGVDKNHIVSEYGMCELASQAYDFVDDPNGATVALKDRWFRFPSWAQTGILTPNHSILKEGEGSLVVFDRARTDILAPFRTEDRAIVRTDGAFQLQGRVAFSPLKGCSLLAEDILAHATDSLPISALKSSLNPKEISDGELNNRANQIHALTNFMLRDEKFFDLIHSSLGQLTLAAWWMEDLREAIPKDIPAWIQAAKESKNAHASWLIIPPRTHDFAIMHPLFLAALLNLKVVVRETKHTDLLRYWQELFRDFWSFDIVSSEWRLEAGTAIPAQSIMIFGSDETIGAIRNATSHPVHGFGNWLTLSIVHATQFANAKWAKDAFSLGQQGCMSSRLLIVWDEDQPDTLAPLEVQIGDLSLGDQLHIAHSELDLALNHFDVMERKNANSLTLGQKAYAPSSPLIDSLSTRPLTLPILRCSQSELTTVLSEIEANESIKLISADPQSLEQIKELKTVEIRPLGRANCAPWTGWHGRSRLFLPKD